MKALPKGHVLISILAILWNLMGLAIFLLYVTMSPESLAEKDEMTQQIVNEQPLWSWVGYGLGVVGGFLGSIGLILKKQWSYGLFLISIIGVLVNSYYSYYQSDAMDGLGGNQYIMPAFVISIATGLLFYSKAGLKNGWLSK